MPPIHLSQNRLVERAQYHTPLTSPGVPAALLLPDITFIVEAFRVGRTRE